MLKKTLGYILFVVGIIGFALTFPSVSSQLGITLPESISLDTLTIISAVVLILGAFMAFKGGSKGKRKKELPIYEEKELVGFRRVKKK